MLSWGLADVVRGLNAETKNCDCRFEVSEVVEADGESCQGVTDKARTAPCESSP